MVAPGQLNSPKKDRLQETTIQMILSQALNFYLLFDIIKIARNFGNYLCTKESTSLRICNFFTLAGAAICSLEETNNSEQIRGLYDNSFPNENDFM